MKIYDDTKIYVCAPADDYTGGPLALHQLASALKKSGCEVYMVYFNAENSNGSPVHKNLQKFHLPFLTDFESIEDNSRNIVIFPETRIIDFLRFSKIRIAIYWLSVGHYIRETYSILQRIFDTDAALRFPVAVLDMAKFHDFDNLSQSEYSQQFLLFNKISQEKIFFVGDYIEKQFIENSGSVNLESKTNIVAYNPKKGFEFTQTLIEAAPNIKFIPIENMTPKEVQNLLSRSKIYIDFGNHPGKDRIPRESAMSHCVVITNRRGAADNSIDIPIDDDFKFEDIPENIPAIIEKIKYVFENFKTEHDRQNSYREIISHEQDKFFNNVDSIFKQDSKPRMNIAIAGSLQDMEEICDELIHERDIEIVFAVNDELAGNIVNYNDILDLEVISTADAEFLYNERRIDQFVVR